MRARRDSDARAVAIAGQVSELLPPDWSCCCQPVGKSGSRSSAPTAIAWSAGTSGRVSAVAVGVVALVGVEACAAVSEDLCELPQPAIKSAAATTPADTIFAATAALV